MIFFQIIIISMMIFIIIETMAKIKIFNRFQLFMKESAESESITTRRVSRLYSIIDDLSGQVKYYKDRAENVENAIEKEFGVPVRKIVNEVKVDFNKTELCIIIAGINSLMKVKTSSVEDVKIYISLIDKIQETIDKMTDDQEAKF